MNYLCLLLCLLAAHTVRAGDLQLEVHGTGLVGKAIYVAVYSAAQAHDFPAQEQNARTGKVVATGDAVELLIPDFADGEYAVAIFADSNGNHKLDSNFLGVPSEPVGLSRDATGRFRPPRFADASFIIGAGTTPIRIQLH